jgi:hypothetical protein
VPTGQFSRGIFCYGIIVEEAGGLVKKLFWWVPIMTVAFLLPGAAGAEWTFLGSSEGVFYYADHDTLAPTGAFVTGWIRLKYPVGDVHGRMKSEYYIEADCSGNKHRTLERVTSYRDGRVERKKRPTYEWHYVSSLSPNDKFVMRGLCKK